MRGEIDPNGAKLPLDLAPFCYYALLKADVGSYFNILAMRAKLYGKTGCAPFSLHLGRETGEPLVKTDHAGARLTPRGHVLVSSRFRPAMTSFARSRQLVLR